MLSNSLYVWNHVFLLLNIHRYLLPKYTFTNNSFTCYIRHIDGCNGPRVNQGLLMHIAGPDSAILKPLVNWRCTEETLTFVADTNMGQQKGQLSIAKQTTQMFIQIKPSFQKDCYLCKKNVWMKNMINMQNRLERQFSVSPVFIIL